jgi:16S rRNA (guanine966-N2)-methyltransferase
MRLTSGLLRNRKFDVPKQEVRPTKERVREALFSSLGGSCEGLRVLDLFAGAGSLGMEAWSRGAESVFFVEQHPAVFQNLQRNIQSMDSDEVGRAKCIKADAIRYLSRANGPFDLILADPPYDLPDALEQTLDGIAQHSVLTDDGILVYELRSSDTVAISSAWKTIREKVYGQTRVLMLKLNNEDAS